MCSIAEAIDYKLFLMVSGTGRLHVFQISEFLTTYRCLLRTEACQMTKSNWKDVSKSITQRKYEWWHVSHGITHFLKSCTSLTVLVFIKSLSSQVIFWQDVLKIKLDAEAPGASYSQWTNDEDMGEWESGANFLLTGRIRIRTYFPPV